ncbi:MAG: ABC transporter permease [Cellulomonadaceae bacterium]|nr:ABC transporter permease [Cellulomonadaceae bacterium]
MAVTHDERAARLAELPLRSIGPTPGLARGSIDQVRDVWRQRELLNLLVRRELRAKYKDSTLGLFWSLAKPLALLLVYYVAIGKFLGAEQVPGREGGIPAFAVYIFTGLTAWQLFSDIVLGGTGSILSNAGLIKKVYLPREIFPLSVVGSALFNFAIQLGILLAATIVSGAFPTGSRWWAFLLSLAVAITFGTALALVLSAVNVYLRDVQYLVEIAFMVLFWASPIVYSWGLVAPHIEGTPLETLYLANPMTLVVLGFQRAFWVAGDGTPVPSNLDGRLAIALAVSLVLLWISQRVFARLQGDFAQEL